MRKPKTRRAIWLYSCHCVRAAISKYLNREEFLADMFDSPHIRRSLRSFCWMLPKHVSAAWLHPGSAKAEPPRRPSQTSSTSNGASAPLQGTIWQSCCCTTMETKNPDLHFFFVFSLSRSCASTEHPSPEFRWSSLGSWSDTSKRRTKSQSFEMRGGTVRPK